MKKQPFESYFYQGSSLYKRLLLLEYEFSYLKVIVQVKIKLLENYNHSTAFDFSKINHITMSKVRIRYHIVMIGYLQT